MNILVIDVGTSSMRGILYRENGEKVFAKQVHYQPLHKEDGTVEQDPKDFEDALVVIMRAFSSRMDFFKASVDAISITAQRSSVIPVVSAGVPLSNAIMWQDTRNLKICQELEKYNDRIQELCGSRINCVFSGSRMRWIKSERPDIYNAAYKLVNIPEYLIHLMTGEFVTDYTYGSRSNLMNIRTCSWDEELLELFQIEKKYLCRLQAPGEICGYVQKRFSETTGIPEGIPVISAGGDQQCAAVGYGAFKEGVVSIVTGTGAFLTTTCDKLPENLSSDVVCNSAAVKGKYMLEANVLSCCSAFDWFCRTFYDWPETDYGRVNADLEKLYGKKISGIVLPYFQGRGTPDWNAAARATFHNLSLGTTRAELLKAILEGIFFEINDNIHHFRKYVKVEAAGISGGLSKSEIMNQMQADIYGVSLTRLSDVESAADGAFMIAMENLGSSSIEEIFDMLYEQEEADVYEVNRVNHEMYEKQATEFHALYRKIYGDTI